MAGESEIAREVVSQLSADPSSLTTAALLHEIANLKEQFNIQLMGMAKAYDARLDAIDKATEVFTDNLTRVPTETDRAIARLQALHTEKFESVQMQFNDLDTLRDEKFQGIQRQFAERDVRTEQSMQEARLAIQAALATNAAVIDEKFRSIQTQFEERDTRVEQSSVSTKIAVDAALQAAKEAVGEQNRSSALAISKSEASTDKRIDAIAGLIATTTKGTDDKIDDLKARLNRIEGQAIGKLATQAETHTSSSFAVAVIGIGLAIISALIALAAFVRPVISH